MAERQGFEPWVGNYPHNRLAGGCLQPARPPLPKQVIVPVQSVFVKKRTAEYGRLFPHETFGDFIPCRDLLPVSAGIHTAISPAYRGEKAHFHLIISSLE
jgi:hypothetical protein